MSDLIVEIIFGGICGLLLAYIANRWLEHRRISREVAKMTRKELQHAQNKSRSKAVLALLRKPKMLRYDPSLKGIYRLIILLIMSALAMIFQHHFMGI